MQDIYYGRFIENLTKLWSMNLAIRFVVIFVLLFISKGFAERLSLAELVDIALKNNPETEKVWWNTKRAQAALGISKSTLYPTFDAKGLVTHGREVKFPNGPNTVFTNYGVELCLNYLLFDFGERTATIQAAREALKAANWSSDFAIQRIIFIVSANYYEYLNAKELLKTRKRSLKDAELIYESAKDLHLSGLRCQTDLSTSKAALAQIQMELAVAKAQVTISYGKLMTSLGLPIESKLKFQLMPEGIKKNLFSKGAAQLISLANSQRADLLAKQANVGEMNALATRANRARFPKLRAIGQGGWLEYTKHQGNGYNYVVGLTLDVPVFKGFERIYQKRLAYADAEMSSAELHELQNAIALEIITHTSTVQASQEVLSWSEEYLSEAQKSYDGALESYQSGLQSIFDLLQAQRNLAHARIKKAQAATEWLVSLAQLAFATGSLTQ
jgi:outer membrane protein TolC